MGKVTLTLAAILLSSQVANAAQCHFNVPKINQDVCQQLNINSDIKDNVFYIDSSKGFCGITLSMPGLPDFDMGKFLPNLDVCKMVRTITGKGLVDKLNQIIKV